MPEDLVPPPATGRVVSAERRVRLGEVTHRGRLRLDALARYLQDVADDDVLEAAAAHGPVASGWVVRRTVVQVTRAPVYQDAVAVRTWCSGTGRAWAERRTSVTGAGGSRIEAAALWVHLDPATMRPRPLPPAFDAVYGPSTAGRRVRSSLHHDPPPPPGPRDRPWQVRVSDLDVLGHVNNAVSWAVVEELLAGRGDLRAPVRAEVEHPRAIEPSASLTLREVSAPGSLRLWLVDDAGAVRSSALVRRAVEGE